MVRAAVSLASERSVRSFVSEKGDAVNAYADTWTRFVVHLMEVSEVGRYFRFYKRYALID